MPFVLCCVGEDKESIKMVFQKFNYNSPFLIQKDLFGCMPNHVLAGYAISLSVCLIFYKMISSLTSCSTCPDFLLYHLVRSLVALSHPHLGLLLSYQESPYSQLCRRHDKSSECS